MGAISVSNILRNVTGNRVLVLATLTGSTSYATGGDTLTAASLGLGKIDAILCAAIASTSPGFLEANPIPSSSVLQLFISTASPQTEVSATTATTGFTGTAAIWGRP